MEIHIEKIRSLADLAIEKGLAEITVTEGDKSVTIKTSVHASAAPGTFYYAATSDRPIIHHPSSDESMPAEPLEPNSAVVSSPETQNLYTVTSPMVGSFYRSPSPDSPPFVEIGQTVSKGQALCILEAMKLMNELESEVSGKVIRILAENGDPVEFGQPLFILEI